MVRKRAHAEKALTPPKEMPNRKSSRRNSKSSDSINGTPSKKAREELIKSESNDNEKEIKETFEDSPKNNGTVQERNNENESNQEADLESQTEDPTSTNVCEDFNELPDYNAFSKELSDKAKTYWDAVRHDYHDFSNWTCLLQSVTEVEENIEAARGAYNCFLRYYPLCYGYWKKFADIERKSGNIAEATKVFDRGVAAIPISIDLWIHYLNFSMQKNKEKDNQKEIRDLFNCAIDASGMEFKSNKLWDAYIEWEKSLGNLKNVTEIFDQLIATPTQQYLKSWQKFKTHLESHSPIDIIPAKEYGRLVKEIDSLPPGMTVDEDLVSQTAVPGENENKETSYIISNDAFDDGTMKETYQKMRNKVLKERNSLFLKTANEIKKRWDYEDAIKRPYFHVKPLEKSQIKNWKDYLEYEIQQGNHKRIVFLFERCIVVCALYESFWVKYLDYVEDKDPVVARTVFSRACDIHMMKKYKIHLRWATYEERQKDYDKAALILSKIDKNFPGMIMITQKRVGVARRMNRLDGAVSIYEAAIQKAEMIEDKIFYSIKFAHVLAKFCKKKAQSRDVLWTALQLGKKHKRLYLQLLDLELHYDAIESNYVNKLFRTVESDMNVDSEFRESFAQRKVEFYEEYVDNVDEIVAVQSNYQKRHEKIVTERSSKEVSSKRKQSVDGSKRLDPTQIAMPENNVAIHQQPHPQQQWLPPPQDAGNYYGWHGQYGNYTQEQ